MPRGKKRRSKIEAENETAISKRNMEELHKLMDRAFESRKHRLRYAVSNKDTNTQWDLIAAGVEETVIDSLKLEEKGSNKDERKVKNHLQQKDEKVAGKSGG